MKNGAKGAKTILNNDLIVSNDYIKAKDLDRKIKVSAQLAQQSLYDMCMSFKEMRDSKLYKELGYQNFEEYCEIETEFKIRQVYNYISIVEKLSQNCVQSIAQIGMTKLTLLTTIPEETRTEIIENTDLEKTSVRELKAKISELQETNKKLEDDKASSKERQDKLLKKNLQLVEEIDSFKSKKAKTEEKVQCLENQIKELENKPHDCYEDTTKIDELTATLNEEREKHKAELENLKNNAPVSEKDIEGQFRAYMTSVVDSMKRLTSFVEKNSESSKSFLFLEKLENIVLLTNQTIHKLKGE